MLLGIILALAACGAPSEADETATTAAAASTPSTAEPVTCADPKPSACGDGAVVRGVAADPDSGPDPKPSACGDGAVVRGVAAAPDSGPTTGDLVVYLTHEDLGQKDQGGYYHTSASYSDVDLTDGPHKFQVDMCEGGEMWPDDYGAYNLIVILDQNGNNAPAGFGSNRLPDEGEPSARISPVQLDELGDSPCFDDIVLDCTDGASCAAY